VALSLAVAKTPAAVRGAVYGAVAGVYFGTVAVMVDNISDLVSRRSLHALLATPRGIVPLAGIVLLGIAGIVLTQVSFQVGALAATLPANLVADPMFAVLLGVVLLREHIPMTPWHLVAYTACLGAIVAGGIRLAAPAIAPVPGHKQHAA
jgi:drug/metabolite transporter (DMT)-like permease